jgi:beta-galactosidase
MTACDLGLGANPENSGDLDPKEPGENATGLYRRSFSIPADWKASNSRLFLVFEGVDSCVRAWVNGVFVGYSQDSCLPAEFDVTDAILANTDTSRKEHVLAVQVLKFCDGSYIEDQDMWWLSGIYREVYILRKPRRFICDYEFISDITVYVEKPLIDKKTGLERKKGYNEKPAGPPSAGITVNVLAEGIVEESHGNDFDVAVRAEMWSSFPTAGIAPVLVMTGLLQKGKKLPNRGFADELVATAEGDVDPVPFENVGLATLLGSIENPLVWTAETPQLYTLVISLYNSIDDAEAAKDPIDVESCRVGIRDVRIMDEDNQLCVNGRPITIAGVNRHEFDPRHGRAVSDAVMREDARIMKSLNFNAVRLSHYPQHHRWLDICDEAGLYVVDEANIESHGFQIVGQPVGYLSHQPEWRGALLSRVTRMYERDKNSSSIIIWSLGNESGSGPAHEDMFLWLHTRDPRRVVQVRRSAVPTDTHIYIHHHS